MKRFAIPFWSNAYERLLLSIARTYHGERGSLPFKLLLRRSSARHRRRHRRRRRRCPLRFAESPAI